MTVFLKLFLSILFFSTISFSQITVSGVVFEKGRKIKLSNIQVFLLPDKIGATTNALGEFELTGVLTKESTLIINAGGFVRFEKKLNLENSIKGFQIFLEKDKLSSDIEIDVVDSSLKRDQSKKSLSRKQIFEMPGANGDPVKAVQNLAGVNRTQGFSSQIVIQGADPKDTAYSFEDHEIPLIFHFGGLTSVVMPEAVDSVDFYSAGYQSDLSRALGGFISLKTRNPEVTERDSKGLFYVDNLSMGGLYESKINDSSSFLISGRYSYVGFFLKSAFKNNEALDLTVAPEFMDITSVYQKKISDSENFRLSFLGSRDKLAFVFSEPLKENPSVRGNFSNSINFFRLIPQYNKKIDEKNNFKTSLGLGKDQIAVDIGERFFKLDTTNITTRGEWESAITDQIISQIGWDNYYSTADVDFKIPVQRGSGGVNNPVSNGDDRIAHIAKSKLNNLGLYSRVEYKYDKKLKLIPNFRVDRFSQTKETFFLPRLAIQYNLDDFKFFKFSTGLYAQNPEPQESSLSYGNPDIKAPRAVHYALGFENDFKRGEKKGISLNTNSFYRRFSNLIIQSSKTVQRGGVDAFEVFNNEGSGRAYGAEVSVKYNTDNITTALAYTYTESYRSDPINGEYRFQYDQTHNINLISSYEFSNLWKISGRYRFVTGNPNTPVIGSIYDADNETYFPIRGAIYSDRDRAFQQLDLRFDKKFILDREIWSIYLDIQNILNIKNPEGFQYSYDYSKKIDVMGLPLIPALGLRGEF
jgi:TonB dependent receptor/CarboxypepD_reg-like domain/TonB-dependent Receptor Plug Domain